jgi:hypothetical protein
MATVKVTGLKEVEQQLLKLGSKDGTRVLRAGMMRATRPIQDQAQTNAGRIAKGSGALALSMGRRFVVGKLGGGFFSSILPSLGGTFTVVIAPMKKNRVAVALYNLFYRRKRRGIFHGHFVEFRKGGTPFLKPALDSRAPQAVQSLAGEIRKGIASLLKRRARK